MVTTMRDLGKRALAVLAVVAVLLAPAAARAQMELMAGDGPGGLGASMVSGTGAATVKKPPTLVRMYLLISAKGKSAEEAVATLKERRQAAAAQLEKLGAEKKAIEFGAPSVSQEESQRRRQLEMMIRSRLRSGAKAAGKAKLPETVTLNSLLTAQWTPEAKTPEELLVFVHKLQEQVKAAKLATGQADAKTSEEDKELAEEMGPEAEQMFSSGEEEGDPNAPMLIYIAKISPEERAKAMAEAFQKAKTSATEIARAAGVQIGPLTALHSASQGRGSSMYGYPGMYGGQTSRAMRTLMERRQSMDGEPAEDEAAGNDPAQVVFQFMASASFRLVKPGDKVQEK